VAQAPEREAERPQPEAAAWERARAEPRAPGRAPGRAEAGEELELEPRERVPRRPWRPAAWDTRSVASTAQGKTA